MARISSYATLRVTISDWLARSDLDTDFAPNWVQQLESKLYKSELMRTRHFETALNVSISSGVAALPTRYVSLKYAYIDQSPAHFLKRVSPETIYREYPNRSANGIPQMIAREGTNFIFGPYPSAGYTLKGIYYQAPQTLNDGTVSTNWFTDNAPDLLLYGSLLEAAPIIRDEKWVSYWQQKYTEIWNNIMEDAREEEYSGGSLAVEKV